MSPTAATPAAPYIEYARRYINYGRLAAQNHKARLSLHPGLCRLALQLEATRRNEAKGHIRIIS